MASNLNSDGLQPNSHGLQPNSDGLHPKAMASNPIAMAFNLLEKKEKRKVGKPAGGGLVESTHLPLNMDMYNEVWCKRWFV